MSNTAQVGAREGYVTTAIALHFPSEMVAEADGQKMKFRYQIYRVGEAGQIDGYRPEDQDVISRSYCLMPAGPQVLELMRRFIDQSLAERFGETYGFIAPKPQPGAKAGLAAPALPGLIIPSPLDDPPDNDGLGGGGGGGRGGGGGPVYDGGSMGTIVVTAPRYDEGDTHTDVPPLDDVPPPPDFSDYDDEGRHWSEGRGGGGGSSSNNNPGNNSNRNEDKCRGSVAAVTPISSVMTPDGEGPLYDGPSRSPCEDGPEDDENEEEEKNNMEIDASKLKPCMQKVLGDLKQIQKGVGKIVQKFAGNIPGYDWELKNGNLPSGINGQTIKESYHTNGVMTTIFDARKFRKATDISVARTILHEGVHAYLVAHFNDDPLDANKTYPELVNDLKFQRYPDQNTLQHAEFVRNFVVDISEALQEFGNTNGYNFSSQFYTYLAWGGLTDWRKRDSKGNVIKDSNGNTVFEPTPWFKTAYPSASDRKRIKDNITTEQGLMNVQNQKGNNAGC